MTPEASVLQVLQLMVFLLFLASVVASAVNRLRMPYTVGLVLVGLGLALTVEQIEVSVINLDIIRGLILPELILAIFVPPLIFEAAFHIKWEELKQNLRTILTFAIPGVILTMLMVGGIIAWGTSLSIEIALIFGALIAATDPVAVVALFRSLGVPKRLQVLLEGESLFNDGTAIVVYNLMIVAALGISDISATAVVIDFLTVAGGGIFVGILVAIVIAYIINRIDDYLIEITLTTIVAYGSYLLAETWHVSGVLAVVAAGLVTGN
ncbi:MAG: cation:proton antiporter, partial [Chloroflexota bacterium]